MTEEELRDRVNLIAHWLKAADANVTHYEADFMATRLVSGKLMSKDSRRELALAIAPELADELPEIPY